MCTLCWNHLQNNRNPRIIQNNQEIKIIHVYAKVLTIDVYEEQDNYDNDNGM